VTLAEFQRLIRDQFGAKDARRGVDGNFMWLMEEVGELAEAIRRGEKAEAQKEIADVAFMALSIASVLDVDVETAIRAKFLKRKQDDVTKSWTDVPR